MLSLASILLPSSSYANMLVGDSGAPQRSFSTSADAFVHSAQTTPISNSDARPVSIKIKLNPHVGEMRSGELIEGLIEVTGELSEVKGLVVRGYWQSTTHFLHTRYVVTEDDNTSSRGFKYAGSPMVPLPLNGSKNSPTTTRHLIEETLVEFHRGYFPDGGEGTELWNLEELEEIRASVQQDFAFETSEPLAVVEIRDEQHLTKKLIPFSFTLPTKTRSNLSNPVVQPFPERRNLRVFARSPPPSLISKSGCIEYIIEAMCTFTNDSPPSILESTGLDPETTNELPPPSFDQALTSEGLDNYGLIQSSSTMTVERVLFPFLPHDTDVQDLYSNWFTNPLSVLAALVAKRNGIPLEEQEEDALSTEDQNSILARSFKIPTFGRDPRDESLGGSRMSFKRAVRGRMIEAEGGRAKFSSYEKRIPIKGLGNIKTLGWVRSQVSVPFPAILARHSLSLPILLHLSYNPSKNATKARKVQVDRVVFTLTRRTATRGGGEQRPQLMVEEIRKQEISLDLILIAGEEGQDIKLEIGLQSEAGIPLKNESLSFRTPNIELEYVMSMTIYLSKPSGISFYSLRAPLQVIAGDFDETPHYGEHISSSISPVLVAVEDSLPDYV